MAKLSIKNVRDIRAIGLAGGFTLKELADEYKVSTTSIRHLLQNKTNVDEDFDPSMVKWPEGAKRSSKNPLQERHLNAYYFMLAYDYPVSTIAEALGVSTASVRAFQKADENDPTYGPLIDKELEAKHEADSAKTFVTTREAAKRKITVVSLTNEFAEQLSKCPCLARFPLLIRAAATTFDLSVKEVLQLVDAETFPSEELADTAESGEEVQELVSSEA